MYLYMKHLISQLNRAQQQAATAQLGKILVLAGAGSGKTRVLVHRIAWLINEMCVRPSSIFVVTFTNRAANEMRSRLKEMLKQNLSDMWIGTFHGLSHKLLRLHWQACDLPQDFQIIDSEDQLKMLCCLFRKLGIDEEHYKPRQAQQFINGNKDEGIRAVQLALAKTAFESVMIKVYQHYEQMCNGSGLVDFAELLLGSYELLSQKLDLLEYYREKFAHFLVDEFQDTNIIQYKWLKLLSANARSVTIVGDDDQSIYGWRGARVENIYNFKSEFGKTQVIRLEQNYRSTETILSAANAVIRNNNGRLGKTLWTHTGYGEPIQIYGALNEEDEALFLVNQVMQHRENGVELEDIAVLYRSNAQSRVLEEALLRSGISYSIYGGVRFFERAEIKDILAYLRLSVNTSDDVAFERVINTPPRGVGEKSFQKIRDLSQTLGVSLWDAAHHLLEGRNLSCRACDGVRHFILIIEGLTEKTKGSSLVSLVRDGVQKSGLLAFFQEQKGEKGRSRVENLEELVNATKDFKIDLVDLEYASDILPVTAFLSYSTLHSGGRSLNCTTNGIQLMTIHAAKGLEFPLVFICGAEEGLFPHYLSKEDPLAIEEERRLCYVAITRAMRQLCITYAQERRIFGREEIRQVSRFVLEIPDTLIEEDHRKIRVSMNLPKRMSKSETYKLTDVGDNNKEGALLGRQISHKRFGTGIIVAQEGSGVQARIHVYFDEVGQKCWFMKYVHLETI